MKTKTWKKIGIIFGIVSVILILVVVFIPKFFDLNRYNDRIVSEISKAVGGEVKLGPISWGISNGIWLEVKGFSIVDASAFSGDLKLSRIYTNVSIAPLLSKKVARARKALENSRYYDEARKLGNLISSNTSNFSTSSGKFP